MNSNNYRIAHPLVRVRLAVEVAAELEGALITRQSLAQKLWDSRRSPSWLKLRIETSRRIIHGEVQTKFWSAHNTPTGRNDCESRLVGVEEWKPDQGQVHGGTENEISFQVGSSVQKFNLSSGRVLRRS